MQVNLKRVSYVVSGFKFYKFQVELLKGTLPGWDLDCLKAYYGLGNSAFMGLDRQKFKTTKLDISKKSCEIMAERSRQ